MPTIFDKTDPLTKEEELQKEEALKLTKAAAGTLAIPTATILPFSNYLNDINKIKEKEAIRMFPQADPSIFKDAGEYSFIIPLGQQETSTRIFGKFIDAQSPLNINNLYKGTQFYPEYLSSQPGPPSPELGSYQQAISNTTMFPEGSIRALTVTPAPNPGRFAKDYADVLADKLGKTMNQLQANESFSPTEFFVNNEAAFKKIKNLTSKIPGTAGYIWGNINRPQYSYAEGNWGLGQKEQGTNPSLYVSRINADPLKEADYLFTSNILKDEQIDPRVKFKHYPDLGPATGPSYGIAPNEDISFRKDLIEARGELTTGDLQALLAERKLPFVYQSSKTIPDKTGTETVNRPGNILRQNLERLAGAENITTSQAVEKFARLVPNVGDPATPPTSAITGRVGEFPVHGQAISPFGKFASKTDLRQIGILPPLDKSTFTVVGNGLRHPVFSRYRASTWVDRDSESPKTLISRDALRPKAANKLLNRTVANLIEQSKPIQGLGFGGLATGAVATAMDPAVIDALSRGDYMQAGTTAAINTTIGSVVGGATAKGLQALTAAGYARPAAAIASSLPLATGVLGGLGLAETGKAINRAYKERTGKDWTDRNKAINNTPTYTGSTPTIQPRTGTAFLGGKSVQVPYGSIAGQKIAGRPWWDKAGSQIEKFANFLNSGSIIGR